MFKFNFKNYPQGNAVQIQYINLIVLLSISTFPSLFSSTSNSMSRLAID